MSDEAYAIRKGLTDEEKGKALTRPPRMQDDTNTGTGTRVAAGGGDVGHLPLQPAHTQAYVPHAAAPHYQQSTSSFQYSTEPYRAQPAGSLSISSYGHDSSGGPKIQGQGQGQGLEPYRCTIPIAQPYSQSTIHQVVQPLRSYTEANSPYAKTTTSTPGYHMTQSRPNARPSPSDAEAHTDTGDPLQYMS